jgi:hypothetical protein
MNSFELSTGPMKDSQYTHENFESLLLGFYLVTLPLKDNGGDDPADFEQMKQLLNRFAYRHGVQTPEQTMQNPRSDDLINFKPEQITSQVLFDLPALIWKNFQLGMESDTIDHLERLWLEHLTLGVLHRYGVIEARFVTVNNEQIPVSIQKANYERFAVQPFYQVIRS